MLIDGGLSPHEIETERIFVLFTTPFIGPSIGPHWRLFRQESNRRRRAAVSDELQIAGVLQSGQCLDGHRPNIWIFVNDEPSQFRLIFLRGPTKLFRVNSQQCRRVNVSELISNPRSLAHQSNQMADSWIDRSSRRLAVNGCPRK